MKNIIGFIAPSKEVKLQIENLLKEDIREGKLIVETFKSHDMFNQAKKLIDKGVCALIARGGTYADLKNNLSIPVISLTINSVDILYALNKAKKLSKKVYLLLQKSIFFEYKEWSDLLGIDIEIVTFNKMHEIEEVILKVKNVKDNAVIVGGVVTVETAGKHDLKTVLIPTTDFNIVETYKRTIELVNNVRDDKKRLRVLTSILDNIDNAVFVIDNKGMIEHCNPHAKRFSKKNNEEILKRSILDIFPDIGFIFQVLKDKIITNHIMKIDDLSLNVNAVPLEIDDDKVGIVCTMQNITEIQDLEKKLRYKLNKKGLIAKYTFQDILTYDESMIKVIENAKEYAKTNNTILIYGESGTGKEMFAQSIHNWSKRKNNPFVAVNCAALSDTLLESELFGYEEGAFTGARKGGKQGLFELAHGGTIFLDEINSIDSKLQSKLLRVLEEKEVMKLGSDYIIPLDVRVIVAANEELIEKVKKNEFRKDLFYRLNVLQLRLPSLRERKKDIIFLFKRIVAEITGQVPVITEEFEEKLKNHMWLGNVRELRNVAERYSLMKEKLQYDEIIGYREIERNIEVAADQKMKIDLNELGKAVEDSVIQTLVNKGLSKNDVANILGISRTALWKKINR